MRFLVLIEGVPGGPLMPREQTLSLIKECWAWARRQKELGKAEVQYALADHAGGLEGGVGIAKVESLEELAEVLATYPAVGLVTFKVYPLVAVEVTEKIIEAAMAQLPKR
jgi:hypothetical protein